MSSGRRSPFGMSKIPGRKRMLMTEAFHGVEPHGVRFSSFLDHAGGGRYGLCLRGIVRYGVVFKFSKAYGPCRVHRFSLCDIVRCGANFYFNKPHDAV